MMVDENNDRPYCKAINLNAATFQLSLPSCQNDQNQEYIAIIIPQGTRQTPPQPANIKFAENSAPEPKKCQDIGCQYESNTSVDDRWTTEYRCTIDDCGQRMMKGNLKTKRSPIYPCCERQLAPLLPGFTASDKPIFNSQSTLRPRQSPAKKMLSTNVRPQLDCAPRKYEIMARRKSVPVPEQTTRPAQKAPEIEPFYENRIAENRGGQRPLPKCFVRDEPTTSTKPPTFSPPTPRTTCRPLPRCF